MEGLVEVKVNVPKEMLDVKLFLIGLVKAIKEKKPIAEIVAGELPALMAAVDGFGKLDDEVKLDEAYNLYGLLVADLIKALK